MKDKSACRVLIVDDDDAIRFVLRQLLSDEGWQVACAANGEEAFERLRETAPLPCVILLDLMMPVMDGWTFRSMQLEDPGLAHVPVVVMTAGIETGDVEGAPIVYKPMRAQQLIQIVAERC